jgi:hypothetical protein
MSIVGDAVLVHFIRVPINEAFVVTLDQDLPLGPGHTSNAFF